MLGRSPAFFSPSMFVVSALCVFATPLFLVLGVDTGQRQDRTIYPSVAEVLRHNDALAVAAAAAREAGLDLVETEFLLQNDNAVWIERTFEAPHLLARELRDTLAADPYWAILFRPKYHPGWYLEWSKVTWVLVRQSDLKLLGLITDQH